jgi:hypothetical protein
MVLFCLAMTKHREQVLTVKVPVLVVRSFRPLAWLLLLYTGYLSIDIYGGSIGAALLFGALTIATLLLILLLTYQAKIVPAFAMCMSLTVFTSIFMG